MKELSNDLRCVYFDPNTFGDAGYSLIGPLLLLYDKVILYGPVGSFIERAYNNVETRKSALTTTEFERYVERGLIIPLGFESFFDRSSRDASSLQELRINTPFDVDLLGSGSLARYRVSISNYFKNEISPETAISLVNNDAVTRNRLRLAISHGGSLPQRYRDLKDNPDLMPKVLRSRLGRSTDPAAFLPYVVVYDLLNNKHVMAEEGSAQVHAQYDDYFSLYDAVHGIVSDVGIQSDLDAIRLILRTCVSRIRYDRLSSEEIDHFRLRWKQQFTTYIMNVLAQFKNVEDPVKRHEKVQRYLDIEINRMSFHVSFDLDKILSMVPLVSQISKQAMAVCDFAPPRLRHKLSHHLRMPIGGRTQWMYQFLKKRQNPE